MKKISYYICKLFGYGWISVDKELPDERLRKDNLEDDIWTDQIQIKIFFNNHYYVTTGAMIGVNGIGMIVIKKYVVNLK